MARPGSGGSGKVRVVWEKLCCCSKTTSHQKVVGHGADGKEIIGASMRIKQQLLLHPHKTLALKVAQGSLNASQASVHQGLKQVLGPPKPVLVSTLGEPRLDLRSTGLHAKPFSSHPFSLERCHLNVYWHNSVEWGDCFCHIWNTTPVRPPAGTSSQFSWDPSLVQSTGSPSVGHFHS